MIAATTVRGAIAKSAAVEKTCRRDLGAEPKRTNKKPRELLLPLSSITLMSIGI